MYGEQHGSSILLQLLLLQNLQVLCTHEDVQVLWPQQGRLDFKLFGSLLVPGLVGSCARGHLTQDDTL